MTGAADIGAPGSALVLATAEDGDLSVLTASVWRVVDGALVRVPTKDEMAALPGHIPKKNGAQSAYEDIVWALLNSAEFRFNH